MAFLSLFNREFSLALKISSLKPAVRDLVVCKLVGALPCGGTRDEGVSRRDGREDDRAAYARFASQFVVVASEKLPPKFDLARFVTSTVKGNDLQVKLLIKFGLLRQAKQISENRIAS
jgi:hypothetical protein